MKEVALASATGSHLRPLAKGTNQHPRIRDLFVRVAKSAIRPWLRCLPHPFDVAIFAMRKYRRLFGHYPRAVFPQQDQFDPLDVAIFIMQDYLRVHKRYPNILFPKTFNEKIQARKIFDRRPRLTMWADKYAVREYVRKKLGPEFLPTLYHATLDPSDIPFERLPKQYVVKASHGSGWVQIVRDGATVNQHDLIEQCKKWISINYFDLGREWPYRDITPRILVEEFLDPGSGPGSAPNDYRFFVFGGTVRAIQLDVDRHTRHRRAFYDTDWNRINLRRGDYEDLDVSIPRPSKLDGMIECAQILSDNIDFIRVDLYEVRGRVYFGEMTTTPANGMDSFSPPSWDRIFGDFWKMQMH